MQLVRKGYCRLALSYPVFVKFQDVLTRETSLASFGLSKEDVEKILRYIAYIGQEIDPRFLFRPNLRDENDNMFVELAVASQSEYLITGNIKDFVSGELLFDSFHLVTPATFLRMWRNEHE